MKVLIACEFSGRVRAAFARLGHDAISCDFLDTEIPGPHYKGDVRNIINDGFDLLIAHPSCTYLCNSGVSWLYKEPGRFDKMAEAAKLFKFLLDAPIPRKCIENPIPHKYALEIIGRKYDQKIQPYEYGHYDSKATCLWLEGLPKLKPTNIVLTRKDVIARPDKYQVNHWVGPSPDRWKIRSRTYEGIAAAMATQWGGSN